VVPFVTTTTIPSNPFQDAKVATFLASRTNTVTASVCDLRTGRIYNYNPNLPLPTASMVKIDILAALLHRNAKLGRSLTATDKATAALMVEHSDNDAATILFNELGGPTVLNAFNRSIGMTQTTSEWNWGATMTTPYDEIALLRTLLLPNQVLSDADRNYVLGLMEHVVGYQRFGVGTGLPPEALVGLKNGWFPYSNGWGINSAGYVMLGNTEYLIAVQTGDNPNQQYGRDTVSTLSALIWRAEHRLAGRPAN
jgi:beta-lactamase class A